MHIETERKTFFPVLAQYARALSFPPFEFDFYSDGSRKRFSLLASSLRATSLFFAFNSTISTLSSFGFVPSAFHWQTPTAECCIVVRFELLYSELCCPGSCGRQSLEKSIGNGLIDLNTDEV